MPSVSQSAPSSVSPSAPSAPSVPSVEPSYASGAWEVPLLGDTIGENLDRTARRFPGRDALVDLASGRRWTYAEFAADVDALALGLLDLGIAKGDRVGIWAPNPRVNGPPHRSSDFRIERTEKAGGQPIAASSSISQRTPAELRSP